MTDIKCILVGETVGKTSFVASFVEGNLPEELPTVYDNQTTEQQVDEDNTVNVSLWDTASGEDYDFLRPLSYPLTDVFLVAFALDDRESLEKVESRWKDELDEKCPSAVRILLGTRSDREQRVVSEEEARQVADNIGALAYLECSALSNASVQTVVKEVARIGYENKDEIEAKRDEKKADGDEEEEDEWMSTAYEFKFGITFVPVETEGLLNVLEQDSSKLLGSLIGKFSHLTTRKLVKLEVGTIKQLKREIVSKFWKILTQADDDIFGTELDEEREIELQNSLKIQFKDQDFNEYYDLDKFEQLNDQPTRNIQLTVYYTTTA